MTDPRPIRFLVSDVDGTLVTPDKAVTAEARAAVHELIDAGVGFAFISSRPPRGLASIVEALQLPRDRGAAADRGSGRKPVAAAFNGGALLDADLKPIAFEPLGDSDARVALDLFASMGIDAWVFTLDDWLLVDPSGRYVPLEQHTVGFAPTVVASFDGIGGIAGIGKIVGSSPDAELLERAAIALAPRMSPDAHVVASQAYYLDVTNAKADKGTALRAIASHMGLELADMAAIGDMVNDLPMLQIAGFSIAMGNAPGNVKSAADACTGPNTENGFAQAVRTLVLPRAAREPR